MNIKRIIAIITAVIMCAGLCGCQPKNGGQTAEEGTVLETVLSHKEDSSDGEVYEISEDNSDFSFIAPDIAFLEKCIYEAENPLVYIKYDGKGNYEAADYDDMAALVSYVSNRGEALLAEGDDYSEHFRGMDKLFDNNWNYVGEPAVYFGIAPKFSDDYLDNENVPSDSERAVEAAEYLFDVIEQSPDIQAALKKGMEGSVLYVGSAEYSVTNRKETLIEWAVSDILTITEKSEFKGSNEAELTPDPDYGVSEISGIELTYPGRDFILNAAESCDGYYLTLRLNDDGSYSVLDDEETDEVLYGNNDYEYLKEMLTEEAYDEFAEEGILEEVGIDSYEKYVEFVLDSYGYDSIEDAKSSSKPALYFIIGQSNEWDSLVEGNAELMADAAEQLFVKLEENPDIVRSASKALESGESYACVASVTDMGGGIIDLEMCFADMETCRNGDSLEDAEYYYKDKLSTDGTDGFSFGETFVPADTEYLCISSRDEGTFNMLTADMAFPENAVLCAAVKGDNYHSYDVSFDLKQLSENLPNLKGLYMYQAEIENPEYLTELSELEELSYYPSVTDEDGYISADNGYLPDFGKLTKLKKLYIFGNYEDYGFLKGLGGIDSISVKVESVGRSQLEDIFACPNVTELEIYHWESDDFPDFSGIEALKNLKKLDITISKLDFAQIANAISLEEFAVRVYNGGQNAEQLGKLKNVRKLKLDSVESDDFDFLTEMTALRNLTVSSMKGIRNSDIEKLTDLEELTLANKNSADVRVIEKLPKLKIFFWNGGSQLYDISDVKGSDSLESFGQLFGSAESYEFFGNCPNLRTVALLGVNGAALDMSVFKGTKLETIDCNGTKFENLKALAEVKTLRGISISGITEEDEDIIYLKSVRPDCEIHCIEQMFTNTIE